MNQNIISERHIRALMQFIRNLKMLKSIKFYTPDYNGNKSYNFNGHLILSRSLGPSGNCVNASLLLRCWGWMFNSEKCEWVNKNMGSCSQWNEFTFQVSLMFTNLVPTPWLDFSQICAARAAQNEGNSKKIEAPLYE